jgi:hypothetical protein
MVAVTKMSFAIAPFRRQAACCHLDIRFQAEHATSVSAKKLY